MIAYPETRPELKAQQSSFQYDCLFYAAIPKYYILQFPTINVSSAYCSFMTMSLEFPTGDLSSPARLR